MLILFFILTCILALINKKKLIHVLFLSFAYLFSIMRHEEIPDTVNYIELYNDPLALNHIGNFETGYIFLCYLFNDILGVKFELFIFIWSLSFFEIWYAISRKLLPKDNLIMAFSLFMSFYGFFYFGIAFRNMIALMIVYSAIFIYLHYKKVIKYFICLLLCLLAYEFHRTTILFLLLIPFINKKYHKSVYIIMYSLSVLLLILSNMDIFNGVFGIMGNIEEFERLEHYMKEVDNNTSVFSVQILLNFLVSIYSYLQRDNIMEENKKIYNFFFNLNVVGILFMCISLKMPVAYRFYNTFFFFNFILLYLMFYRNKLPLFIKHGYLYSIIASVVYFVSLIYCNSFMLLY